VNAARYRPRGHTLTPAMLGTIARTGLGPDAAAVLVRSQRSKRMLLLRAALEAAPADRRARFLDLWQLLELAERTDPEAVRAVLGYPTVGTWLHGCLRRTPPPADRPHWQHWDAVVAAALLAARAPVSLSLPVTGGVLPLPSLGQVRTGTADRAVIDAGTARAAVRWSARGRLSRDDLTAAGPVPGWQPLRRLPPRGGCQVLLEDLDPLRDPGAPIGGTGLRPAPRLTGRQATGWNTLWQGAWDLLEETSPQRAAETAALLRCVVPLGDRSGAARTSATSSAAFGLLLATRPSTAQDLAALLVHEVQHAKLGAVCDLVTLYEPERTARYWAPWRPDPRPLGGLLQGVYAHLSLAGYWRTAAEHTPHGRTPARDHDAVDHDAVDHYAGYHQQVEAALPQLLAAPTLTEHGRFFVQAMAEHHAELALRPPPGADLAARRARIRAGRPSWADRIPG
jgi:HEXXH motif-containing protein